MANIITAGKSGFIRRGGVRRRETAWIGIPFFANVLASSTTASLSSTLGAGALDLRPFTITRTRGALLVQSDQTAADEGFIGNLGVAVVSDQAVLVGVTAVPTPATDDDSDLWLLHEIWIGARIQSTAVGFQEAKSRAVDSKAMRKVDQGQDVGIMTEAGIGGEGLVISFAGRMLVKLH